MNPGDLVLIRNTRIEQEMNRKHKPRYLRPYVLHEPKTSGTWSIDELDGTPSRTSVAGFQILPYISQDQRTIDQLAADLDEEDSETDSDDEENEVPDTWDSDEDMIEQDDDFEVDDEDW